MQRSVLGWAIGVSLLSAILGCASPFEPDRGAGVKRQFASIVTNAAAVRSHDGVNAAMDFIAAAVAEHDGRVYERTTSDGGQRGDLRAVFVVEGDGWSTGEEFLACLQFRFQKISAVYADVEHDTVRCPPHVSPSPSVTPR